jgi:hypothetical protein
VVVFLEEGAVEEVVSVTGPRAVLPTLSLKLDLSSMLAREVRFFSRLLYTFFFFYFSTWKYETAGGMGWMLQWIVEEGKCSHFFVFFSSWFVPSQPYVLLRSRHQIISNSGI